MKTLTFKDRAKLFVRAGNGGDGCASFRREKFVPRGGPDGGDGGNGGSVDLVADKDTDSLLPLYYRPHQKADHGGRGRGKQCHGRNGADRQVKVPLGTEVRDAETGELVGEVVANGERLRVARGGKGGIGNMHFVSSTHQAPREFTPGEEGEHRILQLELKMVADIGLVGFPNAGKSTLLRAVSAAKPKVGAYPFTTLNPVIGTMVYDDYAKLRVADIPGLIEGAHDGVGLGHDFLRHIERTKFLVFVLDMAGVDGRSPVDDYASLREELRLYRADLDHRPFLIVGNKMDLPEAELFYEEFAEQTGQHPLRISAVAGDGISELKEALRAALPPAS